MKIQHRIKNPWAPISFWKAVSEIDVDNLFNDPSWIKNTRYVDFIDKILDNFRFVETNSMLIVGGYLTAKYYVDQALSSSVNEPNLVRISINYNLTNININTLSTQAVYYNQVITKSHLDQFHRANEQFGRILGLDFCNECGDLMKKIQDNNFNDNKFTK